MSSDGRAVANFVLDYCERKGRGVTNLALQKIVFFCQVWSLVKLRKPLIRHKFEAWEYGPVLQYLYRDFKDFGDRRITSRATTLDRLSGEQRIANYNFDNETEQLLERVVDFYSQMPAGDLVRISHVEGGPWHQVWNNNGKATPGMRIEDETILHFYSSTPKPFTIQ